MTVSSTTVKNSYSGNSSTTAFAYTFKIFADTDLQVIIRSSTGTETTKTLTTHYTVSGAGDASGGNVTFTSGNTPATGETVVIRRAVPQTQAIDYIANDPFPAESHEEGLDRATMTTQQMQEELDRSFKVSRTNTITSSEFTDSATDRASKALGFDSDGNLTTVADFLPAGGDSAMFQYSTTTSDADPGAGKFRLNNATISSATEMYIDDLEFNGTDVSAWVQSWDDVTGNDTNRGRIRISKANTLDTWMVFKVTGAITDASGYSKISLVYIDTAGTFADDDKVFISFVASGEDGAIPGYFYKFDTGTSDTDPGAGEIAFNNGTYASATEIYINDADANGASTATDVQSWGSSTSTIKGFLHIVDINDSSTYARFKITAAVTDASGYNKITVAHLASNNTFSAADELSVHFTRTGLKGDTGSTGSQGDAGVAGLAMTFNSSTSDADPGAGKVAFNNGTLSSVSVLFVDDADDAGADISGFVQSWDDVSNGVARGIIQITKEGTPSTFANFKVTGAVTDASGYTKVPVTHIVSSGTFSNTDGIGVNFNYSGADGSGNVSTDGTQTLTNKTLTSPKIGTSILDTNGNELFKLTATSSAVNEITYNNAATGNKPTFTASGGDTNIGISILPKGSGQVTIDNLTFPAADGSADQFLKTDGSGNLSFAAAGGGIDWQSSVKTSNFTAVSGEGYFINTSGGAFEVDLPGSPSVGDEIEFVDFSRSFGTNNLTLDQGSNKFQSRVASSKKPVFGTDGQSICIVYSGSTQGWIPKTDDDVDDLTNPTVTVDFLCIAGAGGGGSDRGGGGGAGGYRNSFGSETSGGGGSSETSLALVSGTQYTITIGGGGAGGVPSPQTKGTTGSDSSISGSGITTITSAGGGGGGSGFASPLPTGLNGGSGGGGAGNSAPGSGTSNQGFSGGPANPTSSAGGGAGEAGGTDGAAFGGDGLSSEITGSATFRGGGGGSNRDGTTGGGGGQGGGGNGGKTNPGGDPENGTANTGGGGGGGGGNSPQRDGGNGGSGVVILSMDDGDYSGTTTGSPTVATGVSGKTVLTFTGSGSYTA